MNEAAPQTAGVREFARLINVKASYVTELGNAGRLAHDADGRILVAESIARIKATRDPSKAAVADRHAAARGSATALAAEPAPFANDAMAFTGGQESPAERRTRAQALKEQYLALDAKRDYEQKIGKLFVSAEVLAEVSSAITILRNALENLPAILSSQVAAEPDEARCRALLAEGIEHALEELARQFESIAKRAAHAE